MEGAAVSEIFKKFEVIKCMLGILQGFFLSSLKKIDTFGHYTLTIGHLK